MRRDERGDIIGVFMILGVIAILFAFLFVRFSLSNSTASGIAYNVTNDRFISGATQFSLRAGKKTRAFTACRQTHHTKHW
jgi:hypothetical protein